MSEYAIALFGFIALISIVLYFVFFRSEGSAGVPSETALITSEKTNTFDTSKSVSYGEEPFNYTRTSTNYAYYSGA
jgi:hypothetical protein